MKHYTITVYLPIAVWIVCSLPLLHAAEEESNDLQAAASLQVDAKSLQSIRHSSNNTRLQKFPRAYKILLQDGSSVMVSPDAVQIPVKLESGSADIPLGAAKALKFEFDEDTLKPQNIFIRFISGHVYQLPWAGGSEILDLKNISGERLRIQYADILGILAPGDEASPPGVSHDLFSLNFKDESELTAHMPLQIWKLSTSFGSISFPSPLVQSCTLPESWWGTTTVRTLYGETFKGWRGFRRVRIRRQEEDIIDSIRSSKLLNIQNLRGNFLNIPETAFVLTLHDGSQIAARPIELPVTFITPNGDHLHFDSGTVFSSDKRNGFIIKRGDNALSCKPASALFEAALAMNGQIIRIDWWKIKRMEMIQRIPDIADINHTEMTKSSPITPSVSVNEKTENILFPVALSWGSIDLDSDTITGLAMNEKPRLAYLTTTSGDRIRIDRNSRRSRRRVQSIIDNVSPPPLEIEALSQPDTRIQAHGTSLLRLIQGDILLGTLSKSDFPFQSLDGSDQRRYLLTETVQTLMRTGENSFTYITDQGMLFGYPAAEKIEFTLRSNNQIISIPLNYIEFLATKPGPLPPFSRFIEGYPPGLAGEIRLPAGSFYQGSEESGIPDESPRVEVSLGSFFMDATQVTRAQFAHFINTTGYATTAERSGSSQTWRNPGFIQMPDDPVVCVSWYDAAEFCNWRSRQCNLDPVYSFRRNGIVVTDPNANGYRLPKESEWEYAAGGIRGVIFPWGDASPDTDASSSKANFRQRDGVKDDGWRWTNPVNAFPPTPEGLYGMAGNVWEWCEDWYFDRAYDLLRNRALYNLSITNTEVPGRTHRVMRGGSYQNRLDLLRVSSRGNGVPAAHAPHVGFRCVRNAVTPHAL